MFDTLTRGGASGATSGYEIERSLRFNSADSTYLNRTPSSAGNRKTYTLSFWFKPVPEVNGRILEAGSASGLNGTIIYYDNEQFKWGYDEGAYWQFATATPRYRDPASWYHVVYQIDTTQSTGANRLKIWVNNVSQPITYSAVSGSHITQNKDTHINNNISHAIGRRQHQNDNYLNGYLAEMYFIDGSTIAPTEFAEEHDDTGQWIPKEYEGSYGNQGWYLNFSDNSNTTSTTLGADSSGNDNDWTPNNFSVAAGTGCDSVEDTPTNNFCTFNQLWGRTSYLPELTNGNLDCHLPNGSYNQFAVGTMAMRSGKWYWEVTIEDSGTAGDDTKCLVGIGEPYAPWASQEPVWKWRGYYRDGQKVVGVNDSNTTSAYGASFTDGDVIGVALDLDGGTLIMYKNGTSQGTLDSTVTSGMGDNGWIPLVRGYASPNFSINFGQRAFAHTPPAGYQKLCTKKLPTPTIKKGSDYHKTIIYTGDNGTARDIAVGFQPDLVWIKNRDQIDWHLIQDSVRGATKSLYVNVSNSESTELANGHVNSFGANGFQVDFGESGNVNANSEDYASWSWKESATAGFDIVSYTGTGSATTISHSLGVKPEFILVKNRDQADGWQLQHKSKGATFTQQFDGIGSFDDDDGPWNDTEPTSSVFSVKDDHKTNANGEKYIAYLWASVDGYSKVGAYHGNGNSDGTFILTGFKPSYFLLKKVNATGSWKIFDNTRDTYNLVRKQIAADGHGAEEAYDNLDFLSNGVKMRNTFSDTNANNEMYVYLAFAESPFKYANAR